MRQRSRASTIFRYAVRSLRASRRLSRYVVRSLRASRRTPRPRSDRSLIVPARVEPPVAALQTTLVPRRHQLYPMRAPQRCAHAHARLRTVSQHLSRAPVFARTSSLASPHRHRARYGASQTTTCSQDDARGGRCLWFWRLRRRAIRSREDQKARSGEVEEKARGGEGCEGGEGWRVAQSAAVQCEEVRRWRG